jgi:hypothetical protein
MRKQWLVLRDTACHNGQAIVDQRTAHRSALRSHPICELATQSLGWSWYFRSWLQSTCNTSRFEEAYEYASALIKMLMATITVVHKFSLDEIRTQSIQRGAM